MKQRAADLESKGSPEGMALSGVLGLLDGPWAAQVVGSRAGLHALFGSLLSALVAVRFHRRLNRAPPASQSDIHRLSRELSRMVYLSLYAVIGLRQIVGFADWSRHGGTVEFGKLSDGDLQAIVAYGIAGLLFVRVLAFGTWLYAAHGAAAMIDGTALVIASDRSFKRLPRSEA
jgi:cytochrome b561